MLLIIFLLLPFVFAAQMGPLLQMELSKHIKEGTYLTKSLETKYEKTIPVLFCSKSKKFGKPLLILPNCYLYAKDVPIPEIYTLIHDPDVLAIEKQKEYKPLLFNAIPVAGGNLTIENISGYLIPFNIISIGNKIINGSGVKVAIIDTGINPLNPWFKNARIKQYEVYYNSTSQECVYIEVPPNQSTDFDGHGTHIAGIVHSVAPGAELIILKLLNWTDSDIICAIKEAIGLNASIISMSLGKSFWLFSDYPSNETPMLADFLHWYVDLIASNYNKTFVIAAGNEADFPWHYNDTVTPNETIIIQVNNKAGGTYFLIRWYNWDSKINLTIYNETHIIAKIYWDPTNDDYLMENVTSTFSYYGNNTWTKEQILLVEISSISDPLYINVTSDNITEFDFYEYYSNPYTNDLCYFYGICNSITPATPYSTLSSPGIAKHAITVGSFISSKYGCLYQRNSTLYPNDTFGHISSFSSRGPLRYNYSLIKPEVIAPGDIIVSANYNLTESVYRASCGTSMATPFVAGVIALIKQIVPTATPFEIKEYLRYVTEPNAYNLSLYNKYAKGYGLINITKAVTYLPKLILDIPNDTIILKVRGLYNISVKNIGKLRAKIYKDNRTIVVLPNETAVIYTFNETWSGIYNITINLTGEFLNSPFVKNITIIALPNLTYNLSIKPIKYNEINVTIEFNNTGYLVTCKLILNNLTKEFNVTELGNVTFNVSSNNITYVNYSILCFQEKIYIPFIYVNLSKEYSIFDKITPIIIYSGNLSDYKLIYNNISKKEFYGVELGEGIKSIIVFYMFNNNTFEKEFNITIFKPSAKINFVPENNTAKIMFLLNYEPQNLTFVIKVNNETIVNESKYTNYTEYLLNLSIENISFIDFNVLFRNVVVYHAEFIYPLMYFVENATEYNGIYYTNKNASIVFSVPVNGTINNETIQDLKEYKINCTNEGEIKIFLNVTAYGIWINRTIIVVCDFTPPTVNITYKNITNKKYTIVFVNWSDNYSPILLFNRSILRNNTIILNLIPGWNNKTLIFSDLAGNAFVKNIEIYYDAWRPNVTILLPKYYINRTPINVTINITDDFEIKNLTVLINNKEFANFSIENKTFVKILNISNVKYGLNNISFVICDLAGWCINKTISFVFDNITPEIVIYDPIENATYYGKVLINITIIDNYLDKIFINDKEFNVSKIEMFLPCTNLTSNITIKAIDKAGNTNIKSLKVQCGSISNISENTNIIDFAKIVNGSIKIENPKEEDKVYTSGNKRIYVKKVEIPINISNNAIAEILIKYPIPSGYNIRSVYKVLENGTQITISNYKIENGYIYIFLNLTEDPIITLEFQKEEVISTYTSSSSGGGGIGGGYTPPEEEIKPYFNYTIKNNTIYFEAFNISEKEINITIPYIKRIIIKPLGTNVTGYVKIKEINISLWSNFKVEKAYQIVVKNCTAYIELERQALCGYGFYSECTRVEVKNVINVVFGRFIQVYTPLQRTTPPVKTIANVTTKNVTITNKTTNITKETENVTFNVTRNMTAQKAERSISIILVITVLTILAILLFFFSFKK